MILILSDKKDVHADAIVKGLLDGSESFFRLNLDVESLVETQVKFENGRWEISQSNGMLNSSQITCVWNRRTFVELLLEETYDQTADFKIWKNEWNKFLVGFYSSLNSLQWLNPWRLNFIAENKFLQLETAKRIGFNVPELIVSNRKSELEGFLKKYPDSVLKLMHQDFYKTGENEFKGFFVNKITLKDFEKFSDSGENPIVLQQYIEKAFEVRYTVVGTRHFVCKIDSQKSEKSRVDWRRYDLPNTPYSGIEAPEIIQSQVNALLQSLGLIYGALDFIVTPDNKWYFLEINPMGQFLWIEDLSGLKISDEIVSWLRKNNKRTYESIRI